MKKYAFLLLTIWFTAAALTGCSPKDTETMVQAANCLELGDYENAVLEYRRALDEDDQSVEAYEGLYNSYIALGDTNSAIDILRTGYGKTGNSRLQELLQALQNDRQEQTEDIEKTASIEPAINYTLLTRIGGSVYRDYGRTAPPVSSVDQPDGSIFVRFSEIPGTMVFRNSAQQPGARVPMIIETE